MDWTGLDARLDKDLTPRPSLHWKGLYFSVTEKLVDHKSCQGLREDMEGMREEIFDRNKKKTQGNKGDGKGNEERERAMIMRHIVDCKYGVSEKSSLGEKGEDFRPEDYGCLRFEII